MKTLRVLDGYFLNTFDALEGEPPRATKRESTFLKLPWKNAGRKKRFFKTPKGKQLIYKTDFCSEIPH